MTDNVPPSLNIADAASASSGEAPRNATGESPATALAEPQCLSATATPSMPADHPEIAHANIGVLLVNLGTPDAADAESVRRYLREFLTDPRVIEQTGALWQLILHGFILPFRPRSKARAYEKIWNYERNESPLKTISRSQAEKLAKSLEPIGKHIVVGWAMRYGSPAVAERLSALAARGCERILLVPLYPQYAAATTATVCDEAFRALMKMRWQPTIRVAPPYYADPVYIDALATSLEAELAKLSFKPDVILASFHGIPKEYFLKGDPYHCHCVKTWRLLVERLKLDESKFMMSFQSRFGRAEWLQPYTIATVKKLAKSGVKNLAVITPGFAADCLETLEEIAVENGRVFRRHGGENFAAIACLNDSEPGMRVIRTVVRRELQGWV